MEYCKAWVEIDNDYDDEEELDITLISCIKPLDHTGRHEGHFFDQDVRWSQ